MNLSNYDSVVSTSWVSCLKPNSQSRIRLFCFPYAGAGSSVYNAWSNWLLPEIELFVVNLPGRDARIREAPYRQLQALTVPLSQGMMPYLDKPFVFFGHSMGSLIGFEVVRELRRRAESQPLHLFVSGRKPPDAPATHPNLYYLPEEEFLQAAQQLYGSLPEVILQDPELVNLFLSMMRADVTMLETYEYKEEAPLGCPISVYGGDQDRSVDEQILAHWEAHTSTAFRLKMFPGEHFFLQTARSVVLRELNMELTRLLKALERQIVE
ncbi:MAG: thioesterase domain-containing protein [Anaerolineales bacterium]|nr:MAG: thioesterase domain-containing protein [Anaerolineales bacterium]